MKLPGYKSGQWRLRSLPFVMKARFTEEQIVGIVKESEAGREEAGITPDSIHQLGNIPRVEVYVGIDVSDADQVRSLVDENRTKGPGNYENMKLLAAE